MSESEHLRRVINDQIADKERARIRRLVRKHRHILDDPRMADDYNPETGKRDGIPYWERDRPPAPKSESREET